MTHAELIGCLRGRQDTERQASLDVAAIERLDDYRGLLERALAALETEADSWWVADVLAEEIRRAIQ